MSQARPLSSDDVRGLREELAAGGTPTLWFTASAVGVPEGRSGKVIALDEPAEGDFIQVRPAGSKDVLSFSTAEVTVVKPPRKRKDSATDPAGGGSAGAGSAGAGSAKPEAAPRSAKPGEAARKSTAGDAGAKPTRTSSGDASAKPTAGAEPRSAAKQAAAPEGAKGATGAARRKPRQPSGATVTLTAGPEGQWTVEVSTGKKRVLRPTPVTTSAVGQAAKSLHPEVAEAVEPLLEAAREQQRVRVEQLQSELADAQRMLDELTE